MTELIVAAADEAERPVPADRLAQQFLAIIEGSIVLAKAQGDTEVLRSGVGLFAHHLALLLDWKETP